MKARAARPGALLLVAAAIWGFTFVAQRVGMEHVGPFTFNGVRFALGAMAIVPFALARPRTGGRELMRGGMATGAVLFAAMSLQQIGLVWTTAGKAGFITGLYVVLVPLLGLAMGHRPERWAWIGSALAVAGLYLLSVERGLALAPGDGPVLAAAAFLAVHVLWIAHWTKRVDPVWLALAQLGVCAVTSLAIAAVAEPIRVASLLRAAFPIAFAGIAGVGIAYTLQAVAQRDSHPTAAAVLLSLESPFAALAGFWLLGESMTSRALVGCGLMMAGVLSCQLGGTDRSNA